MRSDTKFQFHFEQISTSIKQLKIEKIDENMFKDIEQESMFISDICFKKIHSLSFITLILYFNLVNSLNQKIDDIIATPTTEVYLKI